MEDTSRLRKLCAVLGLDFKKTLQDQVDESIDSINEWIEGGLNEETANRLTSAVQELSEIKSERFIQLKKIASAMLSYWSVLSTPMQEKRDFLSLLYYAEVKSEAEITEYHALSVDSVKAVEDEFNRLEKQMTDLISKKKSKLDQIFQSTHLKSTSADSEASDRYTAFEQVKLQISEAKTLSSQREDIVTRVEFLRNVNEEIAWYINSNVLTEDQRVARARILVKLFPKMLRDLKDKANIWMLKEGAAFHFDGVDVSEMANNMEEVYKGLLGIGARDRDSPTDLEVEGVDRLYGLTIPRKPRTQMENVAPQLQDMSDGDDSMPSDGSRSDPNDPPYSPNDSNESGY